MADIAFDRAAFSIPVAPISYEIRHDLLGALPIGSASPRCTFTLPRKVEIVSLVPLVMPYTGTVALADIEVSLDINGQTYVTNGGQDDRSDSYTNLGLFAPPWRILSLGVDRGHVLGSSVRWSHPTATPRPDTRVVLGLVCRSLE